MRDSSGVSPDFVIDPTVRSLGSYRCAGGVYQAVRLRLVPLGLAAHPKLPILYVDFVTVGSACIATTALGRC